MAGVRGVHVLPLYYACRQENGFDLFTGYDIARSASPLISQARLLWSKPTNKQELN